jgi:hypothetical protein
MKLTYYLFKEKQPFKPSAKNNLFLNSVTFILNYIVKVHSRFIHLSKLYILKSFRALFPFQPRLYENLDYNIISDFA